MSYGPKNDITIEDLMTNPKQYGVPTFEEFSKNPEAWRKSSEDVFKQVDIGSVLGLNNKIEKMTFEVAGYKCQSLEEVERIALNEGLDLKKLEVKPEVIPQPGGKAILHVVFHPGLTHSERVVEQAVKSLVSIEGSGK